jgi:hypothetical protein
VGIFRVSQKIEQAIAELALEQPAFGQLRGANELRKRGLVVPLPGCVCAWLGLVLTEAQLEPST